MLQARPLYDTEPDAALFVAPAGWDRLVRAVGHGFNVAVVAARDAGKTTALPQLQRALRADGARVTFVDATQVTDVAELVSAIEAELGGRPDDVRDLLASLSAGPPGSSSLRLVERVRALGELPPATILVDCAHAARPAHALFGRLRDELWQLPHRW